MKKYFYSDGANYYGPFTIEELKEKEITRETIIWFKGLEEWKKASAIQELDNLFALIPPPIQNQNFDNLRAQKRSKTYITIDILVFLSILYWFASSIADFVIHKVIDDQYNTPAQYFQLGIYLIFAFLPIVFAVSIRNKTLKIIAIILGTLITTYLLYINIEWLIYVINYQK